MTQLTSRPEVASPRPRIDTIDILRGIAILGIFFINVPFMDVPFLSSLASQYAGTESGLDAGTMTIAASYMLLEGTQRGILEMLFGAGMVLLTTRAMSPDGPVSVADRYFRRNLWLLAFGLFHVFVLLWPYDILHVYAVAALFLFPFRLLSPKSALAVGLSFAYFRLLAEGIDLLSAITDASYGPDGPTEPLSDLKSFASAMVSSWFDATKGLGFVMAVAEAFSTMMIGVALFKWGILQGRRSTALYWLLAVSGYMVGFGFRIVEFTDEGFLAGSGEFARLGMTIGHIALVNLMLRTRLGGTILNPFKAAGRTAFSLYLMQSVIGIWLLFSPWGLAAATKISPTSMVLVALAVTSAQIIVANIWLRSFSTGPVEWAWRRLTDLSVTTDGIKPLR